MSSYEAFDKLIECLRELPGVGQRSAERMALKILRTGGLLQRMGAALKNAEKTLTICSNCGSVTYIDRQPCPLCVDTGRDPGILCVVEQPDDIAMIEKSGSYNGRYHSLMGKISPMRGDGPDSLRINNLLNRVDSGKFTEVILALSTDVEGETTANYIAELLSSRKVKVSRLALGMPAGSGISYADPVTLSRAIKNRIREKE